MGKRIVFVDGDVVRYRVGYAAQKVKYTGYLIASKNSTEKPFQVEALGKTDWNQLKAEYGDKLINETSTIIVDPIENCLHSVKMYIENIRKQCRADELVVVLSGKGNFRLELYPEYKQHRPSDKPFHFDEITEYLKHKYKAIVIDGMEADDYLAIKASEETEDTIILASIDKDLYQIPGRHYDFVKDERITVSEQEALCNLYKQILTGDTTDNIPGIKGVGPAKAAKIINEDMTEKEMYEACLAAYKNNEDELNLNASLVYLLRSEDDSWQKRLATKVLNTEVSSKQM